MTAKASRDRGSACTCDGKHLTAREIDILVRTAEGMSASQIGTSLHISRRTVEHHIESILRRIAAENAVQAVSWCYAVGVLLTRSWPPQWSGQLCIAPGFLSPALPPRGSSKATNPRSGSRCQQEDMEEARQLDAVLVSHTSRQWVNQATPPS